MRRMREIPMLDIDRERMREEFDGFDDMTLDEFGSKARERVDEMLACLHVLARTV